MTRNLKKIHSNRFVISKNFYNILRVQFAHDQTYRTYTLHKKKIEPEFIETPRTRSEPFPRPPDLSESHKNCTRIEFQERLDVTYGRLIRCVFNERPNDKHVRWTVSRFATSFSENKRRLLAATRRATKTKRNKKEKTEQREHKWEETQNTGGKSD